MPAFPSREWMEELCRCVVEHEEAASLAEALDGVYAFVVEPGGPVAHTHRYDLSIRPADGGVRAEVLDEPAEDPRVTFTASFDRWWKLVRGETDPATAIMLRRLKVSGDLWRVGRRMSSTRPLLEALASVRTEWPAVG